MAQLTDQIKTEIVLRLAQFGGHSDIARAIESEFGVAVDRHQVRTYDPSKAAFAASERWRLLHDEARSRYLNDVSAIPIAHKAYRLGELQRNYEQAWRAGNLVLANAALKQAAEEVGGALTNQREISVARGPEEMSPEERRAALTEVVRGAMVRMNLDPAGTPAITDGSNPGGI